MAKLTAPQTWRNLSQDRAARLTLGLAILFNIALFALVLLANQRLTEAIADASSAPGDVDQFRVPSSAFILPIIGLVAWLLAGVLGYYYYAVRDENPVAYTVWGVTVLIQLATWVPVLSLIAGL